MLFAYLQLGFESGFFFRSVFMTKIFRSFPMFPIYRKSNGGVSVSHVSNSVLSHVLVSAEILTALLVREM